MRVAVDIVNVNNRNFILIDEVLVHVLFEEIGDISNNCTDEIKLHLEKNKVINEDVVGIAGIHLGNYNLDQNRVREITIVEMVFVGVDDEDIEELNFLSNFMAKNGKVLVVVYFEISGELKRRNKLPRN